MRPSGPTGPQRSGLRLREVELFQLTARTSLASPAADRMHVLLSGAIDWDYVVFNSLTIKGIYGREMFETWYKMTMLIQKGLDIEPVITHRFGFMEYEKGFDVMRSGNSGKVVLDWTGK